MKDMLRKLLTKKSRGDGEIFTNMITISIICIILVFFLDFYSDISYKNSMDILARKYLLVLETTNTIDGKAILEDIDIATGGDGTMQFENWDGQPTVKVVVNDTIQLVDAAETTIATEYGDMITLVIEGKYQTNTGKWTNAFHKQDGNYIDLSISKASVAKH